MIRQGEELAKYEETYGFCNICTDQWEDEFGVGTYLYAEPDDWLVVIERPYKPRREAKRLRRDDPRIGTGANANQIRNAVLCYGEAALEFGNDLC